MNTNDNVWVELTDWGWKLFDSYHENLGLDPTVYRAMIADDGWQRFQLHELMHIFGWAMYNGAYHIPFDCNEVHLTKPDVSP